MRARSAAARSKSALRVVLAWARTEIARHSPIEMRKHQHFVMRGVDDVEQLLVAGSDGEREMARRVTGRIDQFHAFDQLVTGSDELEFWLGRAEHILRGLERAGDHFLGKAQTAGVRRWAGPVVVLATVDEVFRLREKQLSRFGIDETADVIGMGVGDEDRGDLFRLHPGCGHDRQQPADGGRGKSAGAGVEEQPLVAQVNEEDVEERAALATCVLEMRREHLRDCKVGDASIDHACGGPERIQASRRSARRPWWRPRRDGTDDVGGGGVGRFGGRGNDRCFRRGAIGEDGEAAEAE